MTDQPSPVRASAQEIAQQLRALVVVCPDCERTDCYIARCDAVEAVIESALAAAEARGRQQAEQARDSALDEMAAAQDRHCACELALELTKQRAAALTQALKDYGQHRPECAAWPVEFFAGGDCTCGLDATLTGAQK